MAGADQGDNSGLPANGDKVPVDGADVPDAEAGNAEAGSAGASSQSAERAVTQLLPVIAPEAVDSPKVRAVARRSAAALPAIGRPTVASAVPKSARATVDRRKVAAPTDADTPATPTSDTPATPTDAEPTAAKPGAAPVPEQTAAKPAAVRMPIQTRAKPAAIPVPAQKTGAAGDGKLESIEVETAGRHHPSDIVDADVVDVDVVDAEVVESPTVAAPLKRIGRRSGLVLPDPQTDEWLPAQVADTPAARPPSQSPPAQSPPAQPPSQRPPAPTLPAPTPPAPTPPAHTHGAGAIEVPVARPEPAASEPAASEPAASEPAADWAPTAISPGTEVEVRPRADLVRPGPSILEADTWTVDPDDTPNSDYHGRRRADTTGRRRLLVAAALALIFVIGSIGVVLLLNSGSTPEATGPGGSTISTDDPLYSDAPVTTTEGELAPPSSSPGASLTSSPDPTTFATTTAPVVPVVTTPPATAEPTQPATPLELAYEAESAARGGTAQVRDMPGASNGKIVDRLGDDWGPGPDGWVEFSVGPIPTAGTYTVTVYYVFGHDPRESSRPVTLIVNGIVGETRNVARVITCCQTASFSVSLKAGSNKIQFTHGSTEAPAIDRIVVTNP